MEHLTSYNLITDEQFGFVPTRSCSLQLLSALNQWTNLLQNGNPVDIAYFDFCKSSIQSSMNVCLVSYFHMVLRGNFMDGFVSLLLVGPKE